MAARISSQDGSSCMIDSCQARTGGEPRPYPPLEQGESSTERFGSAAGSSPRSRSERRRRSLWLNWRGERSRTKRPRAETPTTRGNSRHPTRADREQPATLAV